MAHPKGPSRETLSCKYNWVDYFGFAFHLPSAELRREDTAYRIVDPHPCDGDPQKYLAGHFDVRGVPAFNHLYDPEGNKVFPLMRMHGDDVAEVACAPTETAVS